MNCARVVLLGGVCSILACGGSSFRGGYATRDTRSPQLKTLVALVPKRCEDASHAARLPRVWSVEVVETATGRPLLLEHREGYDLLVAENYFDDGPEWVFQVVVKPQNLLREWRIPRSRGAAGTLAVGRELGEVANGQRFEAKLASANLSCSLVPEASDSPSGSTNPAP